MSRSRSGGSRRGFPPRVVSPAGPRGDSPRSWARVDWGAAASELARRRPAASLGGQDRHHGPEDRGRIFGEIVREQSVDVQRPHDGRHPGRIVARSGSGLPRGTMAVIAATASATQGEGRARAHHIPGAHQPLRQRSELKRTQQSIDRILDAYQENLVSLADLRRHAPDLRKRQVALENEIQSLTVQAMDGDRLAALNTSLEHLLDTLKQAANTLSVSERQKIIRLVVKDIVVNMDTISINHCIPVSDGRDAGNQPGFRLCTRGARSDAG